MANIDLADSVVIKPDGSNGGDVVTGNGTTHIYRSAIQANSNNLENLRVVVEYEAVDTNVTASYELRAAIETKASSATRWIPLIQQNNGINGDNFTNGQPLKEFEVNPNIFDQTFGGTLTQGATEFQFRQSKPSDDWRVCILLKENRYGTADAFTQATVSIYGDIS